MSDGRLLPHARPMTQDLVGFIDVLALDGKRTYGIQATSATNVASRLHKIHDSEMKSAWMDANGITLES